MTRTLARWLRALAERLDPAPPGITYTKKPDAGVVPIRDDVSLPDGPTLSEQDNKRRHPDFPTGYDLDLLVSLRDSISDMLQKRGMPCVGKGVGVCGADVQHGLGDDHWLFVDIRVARRDR